nr:2-oxoacid:acceptor oxidoreductase family protein [uncultured Acetatifactor sp.]
MQNMTSNTTTHTPSRPFQTMDGCQAAAHVAYAYSEAAAIYPITPSSPMAELVDEWAGQGRKNIYGQAMVISQMQSEAGAASAVHGALLAGSLATTFTASQGLLLMLPNLYRMAGELLPGVIHVAARTIATHALSIFGDHSDVYACRQTGVAIFSESSVQEVMDLSPVAHLAALEGRIPFLNFFDGFRTSHELHKIQVWDYSDLKDMLLDGGSASGAEENLPLPESLTRFRARSLHPSHGKVYGSAQNPDIFFQVREASNPYYQALPGIVERQLEKINKRLGTDYGLFDYYGAPEAEHVIIAMGSICETIKEYIDSVPEERYGLINVHLYRPFSSRHLAEKLPKGLRRITVLDRTREPGSAGEPLYLDVVAALVQQGIPVSGAAANSGSAAPGATTASGLGAEASGGAGYSAGRGAHGPVQIFSGRYGLSSKDTTPAQIAAVFKNRTKPFFTVGITDDVTHLSLDVAPIHDTAGQDIVSCKFWGLGGDGTVSATKNAIKIIGNHTDMTAQGYFEYDSKKSRGLTISHLRFGKSPIRSAYLVHRAHFVACHNPVYLHKYDMVQELKDGGSFLLNFRFRQRPAEPDASPLPAGSLPSGCAADATGTNASGNSPALAGTDSPDRPDTALTAELEAYLPDAMKAYIAAHHIRLYVIDALGIGKEIGLNNKISTILQAAFFAVSGLLPAEDAKKWMFQAAEKSYGKSGGKILEMNRQAIQRGFAEVRKIAVPNRWKTIEDNTISKMDGSSDSAKGRPQKGAPSPSPAQAALDNAPLSDRPEMMDFVRTIQQPVTDQRGNELPVSAFLPYADGYTPPGSSAHERRAVATEIPVWKPENCIQCTRCSFVCPHAVIRPAALDGQALAHGPEGMKTLPMTGLDGHSFAITISPADCTGCGTCAAVCPGKRKSPDQEPAKALEMVPVTRLSEQDSSLCQRAFDYCKPLLPCPEALEKFAPGTLKGSQFRRPLMEFSGACAGCGETAYVKLLTQLFGPRMYIANATGCSSIWGNSAPSCAYAVDGEGRGPAWSNSLFEDAAEFGYGMLMAQEVLAKRSAPRGSQDGSAADPAKATASTAPAKAGTAPATASTTESGTIQWVIGGDGWAYDIGFGGLDHVLASGRNINILVLDTEVYSNTGGQASKATPTGSTAKFITGGKQTRKKDLASMAMTYGNVYVAQIALGADFGQTLRAFTEAAAYPGPSLIVAYATCISHGIRAGLGSTPHEAKKAVDAGYFHLFRFNPGLREQGRNPFTLDSGEPSLDYEEFLNGEIRYDALRRYDPEQAKALFQKAQAQSRERYRYLKKLEQLYAPD